jgi:PIN domain nuclease of toxin-antitoxin system
VLRVLQAPRALFGLAAISLWEVGKKVQVGKLPLPKELPLWFADALAPNLQILALNDDVVVEAMRLPDFPNRDPADELIVATARVHRLTLLTTDTKLKGYAHAQVHYFKPKPAP